MDDSRELRVSSTMRSLFITGLILAGVVYSVALFTLRVLI